jgi:alpha-D-ribose 1-methylphosphonate 5-triphosphate synthase subunit PhnH
VSESLRAPPGCSRAAAAVLLTIADADVRLHLGPAAPSLLADWLRFHTGVRLAPQEAADWLLFDVGDVGVHGFAGWRAGDDEAPHTAPTLLIDVPSLNETAGADAVDLRLTGPGIERQHELAVGGLDASFWRQRIAQQAEFPRGVDLVLCCGDRLAALPRSTRVQLPKD